MSYNSKYTGAEVEALLDAANGKQDKITDLDAIRSGAAAGATALQSVPAEYVTETELTNKGYATTSALEDKVDKVTGKQLSTEDFTTALKTKLEGLSNYNDAEISTAVSNLQTQLNTLVSGNANDAINSFNEIIAFLDGVKDTQDLASIIASIEQQIAAKMDKVTLATVATSGSYNDLSNKPTIPSAVTESTVSGWGFTKNAGTITGIKMNGASKGTSGVVDLGTVITSHQDISGKQDKLVSGTNIKTVNGTSILGSGDIAISGGGGGTITGVSANGTSIATSGVANIPAASTYAYGVTKLSSATNSTSTTLAATASAVKSAYDLANSYKGTVTGVKINGTTKSPTSGTVDLGTVITSHQDISGKQDKLVSGTNIKTINGTSILGSGDITISGGGSGGGSSSGTAKECVEVIIDTSSPLPFADVGMMEPNKIYVLTTPAIEIAITGFVPSGNLVDEYTLHFPTDEMGSMLMFSGNYNILWANGIKNTLIMEDGLNHELSITATMCNGEYIYKGIITPFGELL